MGGVGALGLTRLAGAAVAEARVRRPASLVVAANVNVLVDFSTLDIDELGAWSPAANTRLTIPSFGYWGLHASAPWSAMQQAAFLTRLRLLVNGVEASQEEWTGDPGSTTLKMVCNRAMRLAAGAYVQMQVEHNNTGFTKTLTGASLAIVRLS